MSIRVSKLLKQLNIGLSTLNEEMRIMLLPPLNLNTNLTDEDGKFIFDYFNSDEMEALNKAQLEVISCRNRLNHFFLHDIKPIEELGSMEKRLYFKWIMRIGDQYASFRYSFSVYRYQEFSEEIFTKIYEWYVSWNAKSSEEQYAIEAHFRKKIADAVSFSVVEESPDDEYTIMKAIENGYGDIFGFG
jgi:hypothetical protein